MQYIYIYHLLIKQFEQARGVGFKLGSVGFLLSFSNLNLIGSHDKKIMRNLNVKFSKLCTHTLTRTIKSSFDFLLF
jgi:NAD kinase